MSIVSTSLASTPPASRGRRIRLVAFVVLAVVAGQTGWSMSAAPAAAAAGQRLDLRVLVLNDTSVTVGALTSEMTAEGIPFTSVDLTGAHSTINTAFLSSGTRGFYQAVIIPSVGYLSGALTAPELADLQSYEALFGVRQVDADDYPAATVGLQTPVGSALELNTLTPTVTAAGLANGFQYLNGPLPATAGSAAYLGIPVTPMPSGDSFTTLVAGTNGPTTGSLIGVYASAGVERMVVSVAMSFPQIQFKAVGHGILTWATRGVHLGYYRNRMTFHVDDAFSSDSLWDPANNCTPGEDPVSVCNFPESTARMTAADVTDAAAWEAANDYTLTLAFNGFFAGQPVSSDPLTQAFVDNKASFRWLNHGFEHVWQGCVQDTSVVPWKCTTDVSSNVVWVDQPTISAEIAQNITRGNALGLPFDPHEYLSGEHSGLTQSPQQLVDNPNFAAALTANSISVIGADASREPASRVVGSAVTVPRHPTILYYNASTIAQEVDEYNWLYTSVADGGSGACTATLSCLAPADPVTGWANVIAPNDAAFDLGFILSNDPRPFYAHTSNLTGDRLLYTLAGDILGTYRATFNSDAPLRNLTLTEIARDLRQQDQWATAGMAASPTASAYLLNGVVTVTNSGTAQVPLTAPAGTVVTGNTLESWGGEQSGWLNAAASITATAPGLPVLATGTPVFTPGVGGSMTVSATGSPAASLWVAGTLPTGLRFDRDGTGAGTVNGTPAVGTNGDYPLTITSWNTTGWSTLSVTLHVGFAPAFTSAISTSAKSGVAVNFTVTTTGTPIPTLSSSGALPAGVTFTPHADGTATLAGSSTHVGTYPLTITASNTIGTANQSFTLTIGNDPAGEFIALTPARLLDTRTSTGGHYGAVAGGEAFDLQVAGMAGVPSSGVSAVVLDLTVTGPTINSYVAVWPAGSAWPGTASLNFPAGSVRGNLVTVALGTGGKVTISNKWGSADVVADVMGYYASTSGVAGSRFHGVEPARLFDTRDGAGGVPATALVDATTLKFKVTGVGGVPSSGVTGVVMNVTGVDTTSNGFVTVYPDDVAWPGTSSLNFPKKGTVPNLVVVRVPPSGIVDFYNFAGSTHLVADVLGYFDGSKTTEAGRFVGLTPARLLDTRPSAAVGPTETRVLQTSGFGGVPASGAAAVVLNVTVTEPTQSGYLTVYPNERCSVPLAANLNFVPKDTVGNAVIVRLSTLSGCASAAGSLGFYNLRGDTHLVVDVFGYFT